MKQLFILYVVFLRKNIFTIFVIYVIINMFSVIPPIAPDVTNGNGLGLAVHIAISGKT